MRKWAVITVFLLVFSFLAGCNENYYNKRLAEKQSELLEELQTHANAYNRMIVWGDYDGASMAVVSEKRISFLETSQEMMARVRIENFSIPLCQVAVVPFPRDDSIPGEDKKKDEEKKKYEPLPGGIEPEPTGEIKDEAKTPDPPDTPEEKAKNKKLPKVFYGVALVRYINMTVSPSVSVRTRLIKQHWVYVDGAWFCDADLDELLK